VSPSTDTRPFDIDIPEEKLDDLRRRIAATRWPSKELVADRSQGVQLTALQALCRYWQDEYDFRRVAERLNALPQFVTEIDGVDVHFIHVKSPHEDALPLIMTHGWPGSVVELLETVGPLTDPTAHGGSAEDAFDLVLPSVPGYGFSAEPAEVGWDLFRTARAWAELMRRLGYTSYVAQGGDVGAGVTDAMSRQAPEGLIGVHTNLLVPALDDPAALPADTEQEKAALAAIKTFQTGVDGGPRHGRLLQDRGRVHRRQPVGQPHPRPHPRQRHDLLADWHRRFGSAVVLGGLRARRACCRSEASAGVVDPVRIYDVSGRDLADAAQLG
jgi:pimeloyl-ACP methyl ester carboxylesterase